MEKVSLEDLEFLNADQKRQPEFLEQVFIQAPIHYGFFEKHGGVHFHDLLDAVLVSALGGN